MIKHRNIMVCIILSVVTFGIFFIYWFICITNDTNEVSSHAGDATGVGAFLLSVITCNIYTLYWAYRQGKKIEKAKADYEIPASEYNSSIVYLLLCVFFPMIACALMQNEINKISYYC